MQFLSKIAGEKAANVTLLDIYMYIYILWDVS